MSENTPERALVLEKLRADAVAEQLDALARRAAQAAREIERLAKEVRARTGAINRPDFETYQMRASGAIREIAALAWNFQTGQLMENACAAEYYRQEGLQ